MNKTKKPFRLVVISDMHCGHQVGLTPPEFYHDIDEFGKARSIAWKWFTKEIDELKKSGDIDCLIVNGDAIDGPGFKSGGVEQLTTDRLKQVDMAEAILKYINPNDYRFIAGTGYHTGNAEDFESILAGKFGYKLLSDLKYKCRNLVFDFRHHTGSSSSVMGRLNGPLKERINGLINDTLDGSERADIFIRSHVHYYARYEDDLGCVITTPALQLPDSIYGRRRCSGVCSFGFLSFEITDEGEYNLCVHTMNPKERPRPIDEAE